MKGKNWAVVLSASLLTVVLLRSTRSAEIRGLGALIGGRGHNSEATAVSTDGRNVVGASWPWFSCRPVGGPFCEPRNGGPIAVRWSDSKEIESITDDWARDDTGFVSGFHSTPLGVSNGGEVVVGWASTQSGLFAERRAFLWTAGRPELKELKLRPENRFSMATDVAADGSVVIGASGTPFYDWRAWRWTESDGFRELINTGPNLVLSEATDVSSDGKIVVGHTMVRVLPDDVMFEGFIWSEEGGLINLGNNSVAKAVSDDIQTIVGWAKKAGEDTNTPVRWIRNAGGNEWQLIPLVDGDTSGEASYVSANGSQIVGQLNTSLGSQPFFWREESGIRYLADVLRNDYGISDISDWQLTDVDGMSSSGMVIVGTGINPDGWREAWEVSLVIENGDFNGNMVLDVGDINLLSAESRSLLPDVFFDLNDDRHVDEEDLRTWVVDIRGTFFGDSNLDGEFNTNDLVSVFQAGQYEDAVEGNSGWETGDWNGDGDFTTNDLVVAFQDGGFEQGPRAAVAIASEPSNILPLFLAVFLMAVSSRHRPIRSVPCGCGKGSSTLGEL